MLDVHLNLFHSRCRSVSHRFLASFQILFKELVGHSMKHIILFAHQNVLILHVADIERVFRRTGRQDSVLFPRHLWVDQITEVVLIADNAKLVCRRFLVEKGAERLDSVKRGGLLHD